MYLAYETLSEPMKALLEGVQTWNVGDRKKLMQGEKTGITRDAPYTGNEKMAAKVRDPGDLQTEAAHPIVRTHPETGRRALYISSHTQTLHGFKDVEARPIIDFLRTHAVEPEFTCRLRLGGAGRWLYLGQPLHSASRAQRLPQASVDACIGLRSRVTPRSDPDRLQGVCTRQFSQTRRRRDTILLSSPNAPGATSSTVSGTNP